ncbi:MAG: 16S rRNA (cytosine(967)-C(5))-methyltransferase RsmB [Verrucomicrobiia bacterium]
MKNRDPRETAARVLLQREKGSEYTEDILAGELASASFSPADRSLAVELTYGVVRWQATIDWLITRKTHQGAPKGAVRILLRLGLYQLFWLERIPDHAAVHETVALAKRLGWARQAGFVNAVLRGYLREREATEKLLRELRSRAPALAGSHPDWLYARWQEQWGPAQAAALMDWNNHAPKTVARVNTLRVSTARLPEIWASEGVDFQPVTADWIPEGLAFELRSHPPLAELPSFKSGFFYVQDPSTLLAAVELNPAPGQAVLDLCAAPGGKATYIAQLMNNQGRIVAEDIHSERLRMIQENCGRLGVTIVQPALVSEPAPGTAAAFDRVLLDAPCSNTGVMRRRVDLRWRIRSEEFDRLRATQWALLRRAALQLKPGGILVYSTCSLEPEENRAVVDLLLSERPNFRLERERVLLPFRDGVDGAYVARLVRES